MAACWVPMGCGASDEYAAVPAPPTEGALPASTVHALQACAEKHAGRLGRHAYEVDFQVELTDNRVSKVTPKGPRLDDAGLEGCMLDVLRTMADAGYTPNPDELISHGGLLPSRGLLANVSVISQLIRLAPLIVSASGVTIVVGVAVLVVAAAVSLKDAADEDAEKERCKKVLEGCIEKCTREAIPSGSPSGDPFFKCRRDCLEAGNCWGMKLH
ncbi:hypothetical protein [Polyangium fumosum]|uniref:Uncharacterized protein n=1 Tax=Polyangium fumosum TaxID=889272 RepID=A0A4U1JF92_9BACT|nr:hypothetical protein [Polyangium fumosum]TKD09909.1 hypothetical protein E8A74_09865 [Polyangium fumosum]